MSKRPFAFIALLGPGILVAATGVGAGDLATAGFAGSQLGLAVLWAVLLGAILKFILSEGLARWQLATGTTLLEGACDKLGWILKIAFLVYFLPWCYFTGAALISACGASFAALVPVFDDPQTGKVAFGILHSAVGVALVLAGGYRLFEKIMGVCIGLMFVTVVVTALLLRPDWSEAARGLIIPTIPDMSGQGLDWTVALFGGVGGTLTLLCYGYWIREEGREGIGALRTCRIDLAAGYTMTALFGLSMILIADGVELDGKGVGLIVALADRLQEPLGPVGRWLFLFGAWGAIASSLLGVWQAVPYLFADYCRILRRDSGAVRTNGLAYRVFLFLLATVPVLGLFTTFKEAQKYYALIGAAFIPLLAIVLLILNGQRKWVGRHANRTPTVIALIVTFVLFVLAGELKTGWIRSVFQ